MKPSPRPARLSAPPGTEADLEAYRLPDGRPLALFGAVAHSAPALADLRGATSRALFATAIPIRSREILILRVLHELGAEAEAQAHIAMFGETAGIGELELRAIAAPRGAHIALAEDDVMMLRLAEALCAGGHVEDALWESLVSSYGDGGAVDAVFIGAQYLKVAVMNNALEVAPPYGEQ